MGNNLAQESLTLASMFGVSLSELFSTSSDRALVNYNELKLIDTSHFKFIDRSYLRLVNMSALIFGLKYVAFLGAYMLVVGGFGLTYLSVKVEESNYQVAVARDNQYKLAMLNEKYENIRLAKEAQTEVAYAVETASVLGVSDSRLPEAVVPVAKAAETSEHVNYVEPVSILVNESEDLLPSCSFTVEDEVYASGSTLELSGANRNVCVNYNGGSIDWYLRGVAGNANSAGDCYELPSSVNNSTVVVNVFSAEAELTGSCSLKLVG